MFRGISRDDYNSGYRDGERDFRDEVLKSIKKLRIVCHGNNTSDVNINDLEKIIKNIRGRYV